MSNDTLVNSLSPVTKKSNGTVVTGPDVCKTPTPGGPVPIPYPNIAKSGDLAKGSKNVSINKAPVCLDNSELSTSIGDDAGTLKGIISNTHKGKAHPVKGSFDVRIEGRSVVRNTDLFFGNDRNTPIGPVLQSQLTPVILPPAEEEKCPYCKKKKHDLAKKPGNNIGGGQALRKNIIAKIENHAWYTGGGSLQAHHVICSEAMDDDKWYEWCRDFGYNIDCKENGVMLPNALALACQLFAPLHRGGHSAGKADGVSYPRKITNDLEEIGQRVAAGEFCDNPQSLIDELNEYSELALIQINGFDWTITGDGCDYDIAGVGCGGAKNLPEKTGKECPHGRLHNLKHKGVLAKKIVPLEIGK
jgi:hypothetical protein